MQQLIRQIDLYRSPRLALNCECEHIISELLLLTLLQRLARSTSPKKKIPQRAVSTARRCRVCQGVRRGAREGGLRGAPEEDASASCSLVCYGSRSPRYPYGGEPATAPSTRAPAHCRRRGWSPMEAPAGIRAATTNAVCEAAVK